jgi:hypothetical protein
LPPGEEARKKKIILICDGLDEYHGSSEDQNDLKQLLDKKYP